MTDQIELNYDPASLPTAQHRAGLAGLLVVLDAMRRRQLPDVPEGAIDEKGRVRLALTEAGLTAVLNDLYAASTEEIRVNAVRKDRSGQIVEPIRTETESVTDPKTGKEKTRTLQVYPQVVPGTPFLRALAVPEPWLKLWRDAVWATLRGVPKTRLPYEQRAAGADVKEAGQLWAELLRWQPAQTNGRPMSTEVSSALYLGAQAVNAEQVPFVGSPNLNLLLHFWPVVMGIGESRRIEMDNGRPSEKTTGYVLTVPDVADLESFLDILPGIFEKLDSSLNGFRPRDAVLSLPEEGALTYLSQLSTLSRARALKGELRYTVSGIDVFQLAKKGNSVAMSANGRVPAERSLVEGFQAIQGRNRHLLFRAQLIRNLLGSRPWYDGFDRIFAAQDSDLFIGPAAGSFARDVGNKFQVMEMEMSDSTADLADLSKRIRLVMSQYVNRRSEAKSGKTWESFKDKKTKDPETNRERVDVPKEYREAREKICQDAFLAMRARRTREDFVAYFTDTICQVPQYLPEADFQALVAALLSDDSEWEQVKAISMLALSSLSRV